MAEALGTHSGPYPDGAFWQPELSSSVGRRKTSSSRGLFADDRWDLREIVADQDHADPSVILWNRVPVSFRTSLKQAAFDFLHAGSPLWFVSAHGHATEQFTSAFGVYRTVLDWRSFAAHLEARGAQSFADCTPQDYETWASSTVLDQGLSRTRVKSALFGVSRLWATLQTTARDAKEMPPPPWYGMEALAEHLPPERRSGENLTPVIPEDTMALLLSEALRFVDDFADSIIEARVEYKELYGTILTRLQVPQGSTGAQCEVIRGYFENMKRAGKDIPHHNGSVARTAIAAQLGVNPRFFSDALRRRPDLKAYGSASHEKAILPGARSRPLAFPGWEAGIPMDAVEEAFAFLGVSIFIVISYLTGMRPSEVLNLQRGCLQASSVNPSHKVLRGSASKSRHGHSHQEEWLAITPVVHAVNVLERMSSSKTLFAQSAVGATTRSTCSKTDRPLLTKTMTDRLAWFCRRIEDNTNTSMKLDHQQYPTIRMFRRTVAWYIARRPGGLVALAFQYKHLRTLTSAGYAARRKDGFPQLVAIETMRYATEFLSKLATNPERVSGPSADKLLANVDEFRAEFLGTFLTDQQLGELARSGRFPVYVNDDLHLACHFDPKKAACVLRQAKPETPRIHECVDTCSNAVRTDSLMSAANATAEHWIVLADRPTTSPFVAERLRAAALGKARRVQAHNGRAL